MTETEFWQRVEMCKERLWRLGRMWLGSDTAAVDVLDEAVLRAYIALPISDHHAVLPFWHLMEGDVGPLEEPFDSFMEPYHEERDLQAHIAWDEWIEGNSADSAYCLLTIRVDKPLVEEENQTLLLYFDKAVV